MTTVLAAECVAKSFGARRVLTAASLRAVTGETRALVGRNGEGKSTLLKIAAGILQPDGGAVLLDGEGRPGRSFASLARAGLFYLPDHGLLAPAFSVRRQLAMLAARFGGGDPERAAERTGVAAILDRRPTTLSGGDRRRAELAAAIVRRPRCLLADEPYRGVAPLDAELLTDVFRELAADGCAVVITGHELRTVLAAVDHVTWCAGGTTHELGPPALATSDFRFRREYLGPRWV